MFFFFFKSNKLIYDIIIVRRVLHDALWTLYDLSAIFDYYNILYFYTRVTAIIITLYCLLLHNDERGPICSKLATSVTLPAKHFARVVTIETRIL